MLAAYAAPSLAHSWHNVNFANRPLYAYPLPSGRDDLIGSLTTYRIQPGDTLLDVGRWFGLSAKEISDANGHIDWWLPPAGREVILPTEHILPDSPRTGIILNVPEMRLYYYYPSPTYAHARAQHKKGKLTPIALGGGSARVVYTFPVGLGRFDWKTPLGVWRVTAKVKNPIWVMPDDIYQEHLERDGEAEKVVPAGPDNPARPIQTRPQYSAIRPARNQRAVGHRDDRQSWLRATLSRGYRTAVQQNAGRHPG